MTRASTSCSSACRWHRPTVTPFHRILQRFYKRLIGALHADPILWPKPIHDKEMGNDHRKGPRHDQDNSARRPHDPRNDDLPRRGVCHDRMLVAGTAIRRPGIGRHRADLRLLARGRIRNARSLHRALRPGGKGRAGQQDRYHDRQGGHHQLHVGHDDIGRQRPPMESVTSLSARSTTPSRPSVSTAWRRRRTT